MPGHYLVVSYTSTRTHIRSFKGRRVNRHAPVFVYRNLGGSLRSTHGYSVMQNGLVVGHTQIALLHDVTFVVREAGRKRTLESGVKNVHAFAIGKLCYTHLFFDDDRGVRLTHRAGYDTKLGNFWVDHEHEWLTGPDAGLWTSRFRMTGAACALLSNDGLSVDEFRFTGDIVSTKIVSPAPHRSAGATHAVAVSDAASHT